MQNGFFVHVYWWIWICSCGIASDLDTTRPLESE